MFTRPRQHGGNLHRCDMLVDNEHEFTERDNVGASDVVENVRLTK